MSSNIILSLWGPNLDQLGKRDPTLYGSQTLDELVADGQIAAKQKGFELEHLQSANEAELVAAIHGARARCAAIVINAGAFTHYGWSLHDALQIFDGVVIELHLSQVTARESWRHTSVVAPVADALIAGLGPHGFTVAIDAAAYLTEAG